MASADLELQGAIVARLKAHAPLVAIVAARVFDMVPEREAFPYVTFGATDQLNDDTSCGDGLSIFIDIHAWSRAVGAVEAKKIAYEITVALKGFEPALATNTVQAIDHRQTQTFRDPDGLTTHSVVQFVVNTQAP